MNIVIQEEKILVRNLFKLTNTVTFSDLSEKFSMFLDANVDYSKDISKILEFIKNFHIKTAGFPHVDLIISYFKEMSNISCVDLLEDIQNEKYLTVEDFEFNLNILVNKTKIKILSNALNECQEKLFSVGKDVSNDSSVEDIVSLFNANINKLYDNVNKTDFMSGDISEYKDKFRKRLESTRANIKDDVIPSGVDVIDKNIGGGIKRGHLSFILGFAGAFKTGSCVNWAVSACIRGYNVLYITMENSAEEITNQIYACLSSDPIFSKFCNTPPSHTAIGEGDLNDDQERLVEYAITDYQIKKESGEYGQLNVHQAIADGKGKITLSYIRNIANRFNTQCGNDLDMIVIDCPNLLSPDEKVSSSDSKSAALNGIIRDIKIFARSFNKGKGVCVLCPHQINRDGHERAKKDEFFRYDHKCIADLNEIERSADLIMTVFSDSDDLVKSNMIKVQFLKSRHHGAPKDTNMEIFANLGTRRWGDLDDHSDSLVVFDDDFNIDFEEISEVVSL